MFWAKLLDQIESRSPFNHEKKRVFFFTLIMHPTSIKCDRHREKLDEWEENESKYNLGRKKERERLTKKKKTPMGKEMCWNCYKRNNNQKNVSKLSRQSL